MSGGSGPHLPKATYSTTLGTGLSAVTGGLLPSRHTNTFHAPSHPSMPPTVNATIEAAMDYAGMQFHHLDHHLSIAPNTHSNALTTVAYQLTPEVQQTIATLEVF